MSKNKKSKKDLKIDRQISRNRRNELRNKIRENVELHRNNTTYHILFISKETENMEKILFNLDYLKNYGYLINLPIITQEMINEYDGNKNFNELILHYFGIESNYVQQIEGTNLIIVKDFKIINNSQNLMEFITRFYNQYSWFDNNCVTTLYGEKIFKGDKLKDFFMSKINLNNYYIFQDTLVEIILYRIVAGKIDKNEFLSRYFGTFFNDLGVMTGFKKRSVYSRTMEDRFFESCDEELNAIKENEKLELENLNNDGISRKRVFKSSNNKMIK